MKDTMIEVCPQWTRDFPNRKFELRKVRGVDFRIGMGVAWNMGDPTASRDDIIDIARSLVRHQRHPSAELRRYGSSHGAGAKASSDH